MDAPQALQHHHLAAPSPHSLPHQVLQQQQQFGQQLGINKFQVTHPPGTVLQQGSSFNSNVSTSQGYTEMQPQKYVALGLHQPLQECGHHQDVGSRNNNVYDPQVNVAVVHARPQQDVAVPDWSQQDAAIRARPHYEAYVHAWPQQNVTCQDIGPDWAHEFPDMQPGSGTWPQHHQHPTTSQQVPIVDKKGSQLAPCGYLLRTQPPPPPQHPPFYITYDNTQQIQDWFLDYYATSTFNTCPHHVSRPTSSN